MKKKDLIMICSALLAIAGMVLVGMGESSVTAISWGLSFRQEGAAPQGPADVQELAKYNAAYLGNTREKVIYLTFDAGYENGCTEKILDALKAHNAPAAFFLVGNYIEKNPDLVRRMVADGHIVGNHTMHHPDMAKIKDKSTFEKELKDLEATFRAVTGKELPKYYRPPQGNYSQENLKMAKDMGYRTVFWSLAYVDWKNDAQPQADAATQKVLSRTHNGAVVLLHSTSQTNAEILDTLLTKWEQQGYRFAPITELFT